ERLDFALTIDDEAQGNGLHPAGAGAANDLAAEQVAQRIADDAVEDAARFLGPDELHVDFAGVGQRVLHGGTGDLVERDAVGAIRVKAQFVFAVPGNCLAFAVGVGRQVNLVGLARLALQFGDDLFGAAAALRFAFFAIDDDVLRLPAGGDIDAGHFLTL